MLISAIVSIVTRVRFLLPSCYTDTWKREHQYVDKEWHTKEYCWDTHIILWRSINCVQNIYGVLSYISHSQANSALGCALQMGERSGLVDLKDSAQWLSQLFFQVAYWLCDQTQFSLIPYSLTFKLQNIKDNALLNADSFPLMSQPANWRESEFDLTNWLLEKCWITTGTQHPEAKGLLSG